MVAMVGHRMVAGVPVIVTGAAELVSGVAGLSTITFKIAAGVVVRL